MGGEGGRGGSLSVWDRSFLPTPTPTSSKLNPVLVANSAQNMVRPKHYMYKCVWRMHLSSHLPPSSPAQYSPTAPHLPHAQVQEAASETQPQWQPQHLTRGVTSQLYIITVIISLPWIWDKYYIVAYVYLPLHYDTSLLTVVIFLQSKY